MWRSRLGSPTLCAQEPDIREATIQQEILTKENFDESVTFAKF